MSYGQVGLGLEIPNAQWSFPNLGQKVTAGTKSSTSMQLTCIDQGTFAGITGCLADPSKPICAAYVDKAGRLTTQGKALAALPLCFHPDMPAGCMTPDIASGLDYCKKHASTGPTPLLNALCWGAHKDPAYWAALNALPSCDTHEQNLPPPPPDDSKKRMMMWGGLLLLLVAAGGYVVYRQTRKKKGLRPNWRYRANARLGHPRLSSGARGRARRRAFAAARDEGLSRTAAAREAVARVPLSQAEQIAVTLQTGRRRAA